MPKDDATLYCYDGQSLIGTVHSIAGAGFDAFDARGVRLGNYSKRKDAIGAVSAAAPPVCAADARRDNTA